MSLPLWECGLKSQLLLLMLKRARVTPLVGVWIEIHPIINIIIKHTVTPLVGVWIEIPIQWCQNLSIGSLPLWECGLK